MTSDLAYAIAARLAETANVTEEIRRRWEEIIDEELRMSTISAVDDQGRVYVSIIATPAAKQKP